MEKKALTARQEAGGASGRDVFRQLCVRSFRFFAGKKEERSDKVCEGRREIRPDTRCLMQCI